MDLLMPSPAAPLLSTETPLSAQQDAPAGVWPVDLSSAARALELTVGELVGGFVRHAPHAYAARGVVAKRGDNVDFSVRQNAQPVVALLSCASRPSELDTPDLPRALIKIKGQPIICHVLRQLHLGGVDKCVIVVGYGGQAIIDEIGRCPMLRHLAVDFVNLGPKYSSGFTRSLAAAAPYLPRGAPFLLSTADHIFEDDIMLPLTTVRAQLKLDRIATLSSSLDPSQPTEAGLFLISDAVVGHMQHLVSAGNYFTLSDCLQHFASRGQVEAHLVNGRTWFGLETTKSVAKADAPSSPILRSESRWARSKQRGSHTILTVLTGRKGAVGKVESFREESQEADEFILAKSYMLLGYSSSCAHVSYTRSKPPDLPHGSSNRLSGVVLNCEQWGSCLSHASATMSEALCESRTSSSSVERSTGATAAEGCHPGLAAAITPIKSRDPKLTGDASVLSISCNSWHGGDIPVLGFLVEGKDGATPMVAVIQVEGGTVAGDGEAVCGVHNVRACFDTQRLCIKIQRTTPFIGYVLLLASCILGSAVGAAQVDNNATTGLMRCVWRATTGLMLFGSVAAWRNRAVSLHWDVWMRLLGLSFGYTMYYGAFEIALDEAPSFVVSFFNHLPFVYFSAYRVFLKLSGWLMLPLLPTSRLLLTLWTLLALTTAVLLTAPWQGPVSEDVVSACLVSGLVGSTGAAMMLWFAHLLRHDRVDLWFMSGIMQAFSWAVFLGCTLVSKDINHDIRFVTEKHYENGIIGWLVPFEAQRFLSHVCVSIATVGSVMGFMASLQYFELITLALAMLGAPIFSTALGVIVGAINPPSPLQYVGGAVMVAFVALAVGCNHRRIGVVAMAVRDDTHTYKVLPSQGEYVYDIAQYLPSYVCH